MAFSSEQINRTIFKAEIDSAEITTIGRGRYAARHARTIIPVLEALASDLPWYKKLLAWGVRKAIEFLEGLVDEFLEKGDG